MRHAYLIMAHDQPEVLKSLLLCLDHRDNDVFVHLDKKSDLKKESFYGLMNFGKLIFTERLSVMWGGYSQIRAELLLLKRALEFEQHDYYHFLTGVDLPVRPITDINDFFLCNKGYEFVHFVDKESANANYEGCFLYRHYFRELCGRKKNFFTVLNRLGIGLQKMLKHRNRSISMEQFQLGSAYWDITEELAKYILYNEKLIERAFKNTNCCDEVFIQTLIWNSPYRKRLWKPYLNL